MMQGGMGGMMGAGQGQQQPAQPPQQAPVQPWQRGTPDMPGMTPRAPANPG